MKCKILKGRWLWFPSLLLLWCFLLDGCQGTRLQRQIFGTFFIFCELKVIFCLELDTHRKNLLENVTNTLAELPFTQQQEEYPQHPQQHQVGAPPPPESKQSYMAHILKA
jgi:hypothetical protein